MYHADGVCWSEYLAGAGHVFGRIHLEAREVSAMGHLETQKSVADLRERLAVSLSSRPLRILHGGDIDLID